MVEKWTIGNKAVFVLSDGTFTINGVKYRQTGYNAIQRTIQYKNMDTGESYESDYDKVIEKVMKYNNITGLQSKNKPK